MNAGGESYTTSEGKTFWSDTNFTGGRLSTAVEDNIEGTVDDALYYQGRYGSRFDYKLPLPDGQYQVILYFVETWWGKQAVGGVGSRRFHVSIEGEQKLTNYDIFARAKGSMRAVKQSFLANGTDGELTIDFSAGAKDFAYVTAIEVLSAPVNFYIWKAGLFNQGSKTVSA